ncbi:hypothetical protein K505DRAFT_376841 [Melanomma pulvis-pyrius CBS 109.77]|uniref:Uncharacterized protein n=1 Tax=Melanomma pulvis-pyrius CBS 109.77 TaxID=1314802 RepID=A0A6A6X4X1_9PLEO|nr:hypothetical protein K505DRAFT_376841 [Melanomma pulvis-pyrius CBS 109.77]
MAKTNGKETNLPYNWNDVTSKLSLTSNAEIPKLILSPAFLEPWVDFRDELPIIPDTSLSHLQPSDKDAMTVLATTIYTLMESLHTTPYDRPTPMEKSLWSPQTFLSCLIYQASRNLATPNQLFGPFFTRSALKNEAGRTKACLRIRGIIMLATNLIFNYTTLGPSNVVHKIEALRPARNPRWSPIKEVSLKFILGGLGVGELRKKVLDGERRKGEDEKEWLIRLLMKKEGVDAGADGAAAGEVERKKGMDKDREMMKKEKGFVTEVNNGTGTSTGVKRVRDSEETVAVVVAKKTKVG